MTMLDPAVDARVTDTAATFMAAAAQREHDLAHPGAFEARLEHLGRRGLVRRLDTVRREVQATREAGRDPDPPALRAARLEAGLELIALALLGEADA